MKERVKRLYWKAALKQWDGVGIIEVILILVVIIGLVFIFRNQIMEIMDKAFKSIISNGDKASDAISITTPAPKSQ